MSLHIDIDTITEVLLADGWHHVHDESFDLDSYEYVYATADQSERGDFDTRHGGGASGVCATGFQFDEQADGGQSITRIFGPLTSIIAVRAEAV